MNLLFILTNLNHLLQERSLCAHPCLELYREGQMYFMAPLARQGDFYVPEVQPAETSLSEQEELHSDSDVSGTCTSCCTALADTFLVLTGMSSGIQIKQANKCQFHLKCCSVLYKILISAALSISIATKTSFKRALKGHIWYFLIRIDCFV